MPDATELPMDRSADPQQVDSLTDSPHQVDIEQAIQERLRLHPRARTREIVAMLELEGVRVSAEQVARLHRLARPAPGRPR